MAIVDDSLNLFTIKKDDGYIEVIKKSERNYRLYQTDEECICITATGWINDKVQISKDKKCFTVPYSLHSNYEEIEEFVRSIKPSILRKIVNNDDQNVRSDVIILKSRLIISIMLWQGVEFLNNPVTDLMQMKQRGYDVLK